ncbi:hypothetical protein ACFWV1_15440 [Streptomyces sp. NPDC058700]|uniref:hypothetical protein n=1 Tax=unclassified Streptomyces TaxID=2593676 RepID=UPI00365F54B4
MGVFAMFRRKKKDAAAVAPESEEAGAVVPVEDGEAESGADAPDAVAGTGTVEAKEAEDAEDAVADEAVSAVEAGETVAGEAAAEVVDIPKQQSAEAAADNEAGEDARR